MSACHRRDDADTQWDKVASTVQAMSSREALPGFKQRALCAQINVGPECDPWFDASDGDDLMRVAKAICRKCPIKAECLQIALDNDIEFGIWGGYAAAERRQAVRDV